MKLKIINRGVNIFGIEVASGFVPCGKLGGERNLKAKFNGYWLSQKCVGEIISN